MCQAEMTPQEVYENLGDVCGMFSIEHGRNPVEIRLNKKFIDILKKAEKDGFILGETIFGCNLIQDDTVDGITIK
jgi:hypothetical protein